MRTQPARCRHGRDAGRLQPVSAHERRARPARGDCRQNRPFVRPAVQRQRHHDYRRRHPGADHRHPVLRAPGRRSDRDRTRVRQLCASDYPRGRHRRMRADGHARQRLHGAVGQGGSRRHQPHPADRHQHPAQSHRQHLARLGHACAGRHRARHQYIDPVRRSVRTHGIRRPAPRIRMPPPGTGGARVRGVVVWQNVPRHRLENRLRGRAARAHGRVPQSAPIQCVQREYADATWHRQLHGRSAAVLATAGILPAQARPVPRRPGRHPLRIAASRRHVFPVRALR